MTVEVGSFVFDPYDYATQEDPYPSYAWLRTNAPLYENRTLIDTRFPRGITWRLLYDATVHSSRFLESQDGVAGFQWLLFVPLSLLAWKRIPPLGRACLLVGIGFAILEFQAVAVYVDAR